MALRTAEIIAVGSELLGSTRTDTNSLYISERLSALGIDLRIKSVVGDEVDDLAVLLRQALARTDVVVLTGGLGPTDDDLTRDVVSGVLGLEMALDPAILERIRVRFARRGLTMPEVNRKQAQVPRGAMVLDNAHGTAPGLFIQHQGTRGGQVVLLLPGPPREMRPMLDRLCDGPLGALAGPMRTFRASLFITGRGESHVEEVAQPVYSQWRDASPPITTTILAAMGQVELHLAVRDTDAERGAAALARARDQLLRVLGNDVYSTDGRLMEEIVGEMLTSRGYSIAAAESCTGGLLTARLTDIPGSSTYVGGSIVAYGYPEKSSLLGVPAELIERHGAVSEPVAVAMAEGVRARTGADVAVAITGIAGPGGGTKEKPVGTVVIAVIVPDRPVYVRTFSFIGGRVQVKYQSTQAALDRVRRMLGD
jgi:nicotinamide-nucleotide amidase